MEEDILKFLKENLLTKFTIYGKKFSLEIDKEGITIDKKRYDIIKSNFYQGENEQIILNILIERKGFIYQIFDKQKTLKIVKNKNQFKIFLIGRTIQNLIRKY